MNLGPGAFHLRHLLTVEEQLRVARSMPDASGRARAGLRAHGSRRRHDACANALPRPTLERQLYQYESTRTDFDGAPAPPMPDDLRALAQKVAASAGMSLDPDICIINFYDMDGRMGLHQDKDEHERSIAAGLPVVSLSIGDTARFLIGGTRRREPVTALLLESGDAFVFGGPSRLRYHGVSRIIPGTAPPALAMQGRFNLTFRQWDV